MTKAAFTHGDVFASMFGSMLPEMGLRLVIQRTPIADECPGAKPESIFGTEYVYRRIVSNDWDSTGRDIITYYNRRGASERRSATPAGACSSSNLNESAVRVITASPGASTPPRVGGTARMSPPQQTTQQLSPINPESP